MLTANTATGCINRTADPTSYIFADQVDPATGQSAYSTSEVFCN